MSMASGRDQVSVFWPDFPAFQLHVLIEGVPQRQVCHKGGIRTAQSPRRASRNHSRSYRKRQQPPYAANNGPRAHHANGRWILQPSICSPCEIDVWFIQHGSRICFRSLFGQHTPFRNSHAIVLAYYPIRRH